MLWAPCHAQRWPGGWLHLSHLPAAAHTLPPQPGWLLRKGGLLSQQCLGTAERGARDSWPPAPVPRPAGVLTDDGDCVERSRPASSGPATGDHHASAEDGPGGEGAWAEARDGHRRLRESRWSPGGLLRRPEGGSAWQPGPRTSFFRDPVGSHEVSQEPKAPAAGGPAVLGEWVLVFSGHRSFSSNPSATDGKLRSQRGSGTCPRSHSLLMTELSQEPRSPLPWDVTRTFQATWRAAGQRGTVGGQRGERRPSGGVEREPSGLGLKGASEEQALGSRQTCCPVSRRRARGHQRPSGSACSSHWRPPGTLPALGGAG